MERGPINGKHFKWVEEFNQKVGRPPRVLHIGNIANNAYLNAKMLYKVGIESDVLCHHYYHIMGCPEWEDAEFDHIFADHNFPEWNRVNLNGFKRPPWFAQGPLKKCIRYLSARRHKRPFWAFIHWHMLKRYWGTPYRLNKSSNIKGIINYYIILKLQILKLLHTKLQILKLHIKIIKINIKKEFIVLVTMVGLWSMLVFLKELKQSVGKQPMEYEPDHFKLYCGKLIKLFKQSFPQRKDQLTYSDIEYYRFYAVHCEKLFQDYDIVIGYSTEPILPLVAGKKPYAAYEHGTIRHIPFEPTNTGRFCALAYKLADVTFITNCDNIEAAKKLGLKHYTFIPHPVNENLIYADEELQPFRELLRERLASDFIVFHPARQHWEEERHPSWEKGNDILIKGFAHFVETVNPQAGAVFVEWGKTVSESKKLLEDLGIANRVLWVPPLPNVQMIRYISACDLLADQFYLGAFGSTMPKALLHGRPSMLYLDEERHRWAFPEMPPVVNAKTPEEVCEGLRRVYLEPNYREELVRRGKEWYERYHSNRVITRIFLETFGSLLSRDS